MQTTAIKYADLHLHSNHSDGSLPPEELVELAWQKGVNLLSLTDHDCLSGLAVAAEQACRLGLDFIVGVELSARFKGGNLHILGYGFDPTNGPLNEALTSFQQSRHQRNERMLHRLQALGLQITADEFLAESKDSQSPGRPHMAQLIIAKGYCKNMQEAFDGYLNPGTPGFVSKEIFEPEEAINLIHQAGGMAILAHPSTLNRKGEELKNYISKLKGWGLDGVEVYNSAHHPEEAEQYLKMTRELDLLITGGSDYHGHNKPDVQLGEWQPGRLIPLDWVSPEIFKAKEQCG